MKPATPSKKMRSMSERITVDLGYSTSFCDDNYETACKVSVFSFST
jgi:hypothetical protein